MNKRYLIFALILAIFASSLSFADGEIIYYSMPIYTQLEDEWCWNAVAQMVADSRFNVTKSQYDVADIMNMGPLDQANLKELASAMKIYTDYTKSTGYSYTSSQSFIVGKLRSSHNPIAIGMEFANGAEHALAVRAYDDRNYNQRMFYVDPDESDMNEAAEDTLDVLDIPKTLLKSSAVINYKGTKLPGFAVTMILKNKQKKKSITKVT